jgi:hypothetical protein
MNEGYGYENGRTWLPPLKQAKVDNSGHLRLYYWKGNDTCKGEDIAFDLEKTRLIYPQFSGALPTFEKKSGTDELTIDTLEEVNALEVGRKEMPSAVVLIDCPVDFEKGFMIEGDIRITCSDKRTVAPKIGIFLEEAQNTGTAVIFDSIGKTQIGPLDLRTGFAFRCEDETRFGCATVCGIVPHCENHLRLIARLNMFEIYLNDQYVQTFNTTHFTSVIGIVPKRIGFIVQNGVGSFEGFHVHSLNLTDND